MTLLPATGVPKVSSKVTVTAEVAMSSASTEVGVATTVELVAFTAPAGGSEITSVKVVPMRISSSALAILPWAMDRLVSVVASMPPTSVALTRLALALKAASLRVFVSVK